MKYTLSLIAAFAASAVLAQTGVITRLHSGQSSFYYTADWNADIIETALNDCLDGDTLILPGGTFFLSGASNNLLLGKPVVIVGAGYLSDTAPVTQPTVIAQGPGGSNQVIINNSVDGLSIHGVRFEVHFRFNDFIPIQNVHFVRCDFAGVQLGQSSGVLISQVHLRECLISTLAPLNATGVSADNCIFKGTNAPSGIVVRNSVIHSWTNASSGYFYNCIMLRNGSAGTLSGSASYFDCVFVAPNGIYSQGTASAFDDCITVPSAALSSVFNTVTNIELDTWNLLSNYHHNTSPTGPAVVHSAGIYFGSWPWKDSVVPFNPHWESLTVPGGTNGGVVNVNLSGAAQQD